MRPAGCVASRGRPAPARGPVTRLVFVSNQDRNLELYDLDLTTLAATRLTHTPDRDETLPRIGRGGRYAFVVPVSDNAARISVANAELRGRRVIQAGTAVDWRP